MKKIHDLLAYDKLKIVQDDDAFKFSIDCLLLADFVKCKDNDKIIDLCSGNCPIPLYLTLKTKSEIYAVEVQKYSYELGLESINLNNLNDRIHLINDNLIDISKKGINGLEQNSFDIVTCNPPYFKVDEDSNLNDKESFSIARHEVLCCMDDIVKESKRLLKDGGMLYLIYRVERLDEVFSTLNSYSFGIKDIKFVYPKENDSAILVLIKASKNRGNNINILKPLIINTEIGYTLDIHNIFYFGKEN